MENQHFVMLTYQPEFPLYKWTYDDNLDVYTNNTEKTANLPPPLPTNEPVNFALSETDVNNSLHSVEITDMMKVSDVVNQLIDRFVRGMSDADKVSLLYHWLTSQDIRNKVYRLTPNFETVNYQLRKLQNKENSYAAMFALLCDLAGIPCVIVKGQVKVTQEKLNEAEWNAVLVNDQWRFVDTFWGANLTDTFIPVSYYLFPDPQQFIYSHCGAAARWQLLDRPLRKHTFKNQEYLTEHFFLMNMAILEPRGVNLTAKDGEIEVTFALNDADATGQEFMCITNRNTDDNDTKQAEFVCKSEAKGGSQSGALTLGAKVHFPKQGDYLLEIVGNGTRDERKQYDWVAVYSVSVNTPASKKLFPKMDDKGWGPNWYLAKCGLKATSHPYSVITCDSRKIIIEFEKTDPYRNSDITLRYRLVEFYREQNEKYALKGESTQDGDLLQVSINVAGSKDSRLTISATVDGDDKGNVCTYFVDTTGLMADDRYKEVLKQIKSACKEKKVQKLKAVLDQVQQDEYHEHRKVTLRYNKARKLYKTLMVYERELRKIKDIDKSAIANLRSLLNPEDEIINVMKAIFIVLGNDPAKMKTWDNIKIEITSASSIDRQSIQTRIKDINIEQLSKQTIDAARKEIEGLNAVQSTQNYRDVAPFAKWLENVFETHRFLTEADEDDSDDETDAED